MFTPICDNALLCLVFHGSGLNYELIYCSAGNAAIILRNRLKVKVVKESREKSKTKDKNMMITNGDVEPIRKTVQYQVSKSV